MTEREQNQPKEEAREQFEPISFAEFLESTPPSQERTVISLLSTKQTAAHVIYHELATPEIRLHCSNDNCNGIRFWRAIPRDSVVKPDNIHHFYVTYNCSNCQPTVK